MNLLEYLLACLVSHYQWWRRSRACQCPGRSTLVLAIKSGNNKIIHKDILIALADATNDLCMPCHEGWTGSATLSRPISQSVSWVQVPQLVPLFGMRISINLL